MSALPEPGLSISLNGLDNVGKTTQLAWLNRAMPAAHLVGTIDAWDPRWPELARGDFARWWFVDSSTAEHVALLLGSHATRRIASGPCALEDRGLPMLLATCAATAAIKERLSPAAALDVVDRLAAELPAIAPQRSEMAVLLRRSAVPANDAAVALARESQPIGERYAAYQYVLAELIALQVERGHYPVIVDIGDSPILDAQSMIRTALIECGIDVEPLSLTGLEQLWVLGGMSESGKSTIGELLRDEHGVTRLKIGYLAEVAALRTGQTDPYGHWPEQEQAAQLSEEILRFAAATKAPSISLESAHRFEATAHLKQLWGDRCQVVYVDAEADIRAQRTSETLEQLNARDDIKRRRGAERIAEIADHRIDNSGPPSVLKQAITKLVRAGLPQSAPAARRPASQAEWLGQATDHLVDPQVCIVLATGSTGSVQWHPAWSDLDVLVVRDTVPARWLREVVATAPAPADLKIGISVFSSTDVELLRVPPRVVQSLRRAAGGTGVLYRRPDYRMPIPGATDVDRTSRGELGLVLMTTRRLITQAVPDLRALHKHLVLLAKIILRADGHDLHDTGDVLEALQRFHPASCCLPPGLDVLIARPDDPDLHQHLIEATDRLLGYLDWSDQAVRKKA